MRKRRLGFIVLGAILTFLSWPCACQQRSPADTGAPQVTVSHLAGKWTVAGKNNTVELNESDFAVSIHAGPVNWKMVPSSNEDMLVSAGGDQFHLRLADAGQIKISPYETGFKTGIR